MTRRLLCALPLLLVPVLLAAQGPVAAGPAAAASQPHTGILGASYSIPEDWTVVDPHPDLPSVKPEQSQTAATDEKKKGIECVQVALTARHGSPASVIVIVELPYDCFGQTKSEKDLPGFAQGASEGISKSFNFSNSNFGAYQLGTHSFWIERARGVVIDHPEAVYTVEITCTLLKTGASCWMTMANDSAALQTFENGAVSLDGEAPTPLVPPTAFDKAPAAVQ